MKKIYLLLVFLFGLNLSANAEYKPVTPQPILQPSSSYSKNFVQPKIGVYVPKYMNYYSFNYTGNYIDIKFNPLSKQEYKNLSKNDKNLYNKYKKYNKKMQRGYTYEVLGLDRTFLPAYVTYFNQSARNKKYRDAVIALENIKKIDKYGIFSENFIDLFLADYYYKDKDYRNAIKLYTQLRTKNNDYAKFCDYYLANSYYEIRDYQNTIKYANLLKGSDDEKNDLLYLSYFKLGNKQKAHEYALLDIKKYPNNYQYLLRGAFTAQNKSEELNYYYKAKLHASNDNDLLGCNVEIAKLEDEKTKNISKNIKGYFVPPLWYDIMKKDYMYMSTRALDKRQIEFYTELHNCTKKYYGNDLKACLTALKIKQDKISDNLVAEYRYNQQQLLEQQRILELQQMNANLQYSNYLQSEQNDLQRQQNYILNQPRYTNSTTTLYGNTYYTNTYHY